LLSLAVLCLLATPGTSSAQDAGVSGIPPGPGNARGLNGSVNDPSGIGNAARMPPLPAQASPSPVPVTAAPSSGYRPLPMQRAARVRRPRYAALRYRRGADRAAIRERDQLIDHGVRSICKGC
jgi:hypothetical protein